MIKQPHEIDFLKVKRFFAFGCSFTDYIWPTWADLLAKEMPDAEYYNFGRCGGGNLMIASRISEAHRRYKFNEDDLIIPLWTTFAREDRYLKSHGGWWGVGNIFTQGEFPTDYIKKYADMHGYLLRDISIIDLTLTFLNSLDSSVVSLLSVPLTYQQEENDNFVNNVLELYSNVKDMHLPPLVDLEMQGNWDNGHEYYQDGHTGIMQDYHPDPVRYFNYLKKLKFNMSPDTESYATTSCNKLKTTTHYNQIIEMFGGHKNDRRPLF